MAVDPQSPLRLNVTEKLHQRVKMQDKIYLRTWYNMSLNMIIGLHGSTAFNGKKNKINKKEEKKVPLKRWNSQYRFFQPRSGPFSTDTLKCWVIIRLPTSNIAWLRLIQSHSVYETQWYGHNTAQHSSALLKQHNVAQQKLTKDVPLLNCKCFHFSVSEFLI